MVWWREDSRGCTTAGLLAVVAEWGASFHPSTCRQQPLRVSDGVDIAIKEERREVLATGSWSLELFQPGERSGVAGVRTSGTEEDE